VSAALPADLAAALGGFAAGRAALTGGVTAEPLRGGGSNRSFRVISAVGDWVVRLAGSDDAAFAINRVAERQVHAAAAAAGFAPALVHAEPERGLLVTQYLAGRALSRADLRTAGGLAALGARLGQLHALPPPRGVRRLDVHDVLAHYLELRDLPPGPVPREDIASQLRGSLASYRQSAVALCHNDLHWRNVIAAEQLWFVDWEYGGVGDPLFELAAVVGYHDLDAGQRAVLLAAHGGAFRPPQVEQMCRVFDCLHALWLDAARGWDALEPARRVALLARLTIEAAQPLS
jgi:thiamine kinase-like enzyme